MKREAAVTRSDAGPTRAGPYGWVGLPLSLAAILVLAFAMAGAFLAAVFAGAVVALGWHGAATRVASLKDVVQGSPRDAEAALLVLSILIYLAVAGAVFTAARWRGGPAWRDLIAWHRWGGARRVRTFCLLAAATLVYSFAADAALAFLHPASRDWVTPPQGAWSIILFVAVATLAAPLAEDLVFRGWLHTALRAKLSFWPSLVLSSAGFALAHWESTHLYALVVFPVGLALGFLRERAASLKASISLHAVYNGVACVLICLGQ